MEFVNERNEEKIQNCWNFVGKSHGSVFKIYIIHSDKVEQYRRLYIVNAAAMQCKTTAANKRHKPTTSKALQ